MEDQSQKSESTFGAKRVKAEFNPAKDTVVNKIKNKSAELIDLIQTLRSDETTGEGHRVISEAQTCIETGCMYGVKAVFTK